LKINTKKNSGKHLTREDRQEIQGCLEHGMTFKAIGQRVGKSETTISREVKKRVEIRPARAEHAAPCPLLKKTPFVCNGCQKRTYCKLERHVYCANKADADYRFTLSDARTGIALNKAEFYQDDAILLDGIRRGQSVYHIVQTNQLHASLPTIYRHINAGYRSVLRLDLPRAVKFKPRKQVKEPSIPNKLKAGRSYEDFQAFLAENELESWVEMDTVIGRVGGKVILTFCFVPHNFIIGRLSDDKSAASISIAVKELKESLHKSGFSFGSVCPVLLTDNGGEFANVSAFELDASGSKETSLFFCHPMAPYQKPHVEKCHTLLRDRLPQGSSFDSLSQEQVNLIFSHINALSRKAFNGRSAYDLFTFTYSSALADALGIRFIPPDLLSSFPRYAP